MRIKLFWLLIVLSVAAVIFSGCDPNPHSGVYEESNLRVFEDLEMVTEFSEYDRNVKEIGVTITNNGDDDIWLSVNFALLKYDDGQWEYALRKPNEGGFPAISWLLPAHESRDRRFDVDEYFKLPLSPGLYRIRTGEDIMLYAEFTVK